MAVKRASEAPPPQKALAQLTRVQGANGTERELGKNWWGGQYHDLKWGWNSCADRGRGACALSLFWLRSVTFVSGPPPDAPHTLTNTIITCLHPRTCTQAQPNINVLFKANKGSPAFSRNKISNLKYSKCHFLKSSKILKKSRCRTDKKQMSFYRIDEKSFCRFKKFVFLF